MSEPFLILHKVRGEPAFDIAIQMEVVVIDQAEVWWIIPTSGHRAYPWWYQLLDVSEYKAQESLFGSMEMPLDWPDHYAINKEPPAKLDGRGLLKQLGIGQKTEVDRRI